MQMKRSLKDIFFRIKRIWQVRRQWWYVKIHLWYIGGDIKKLTEFALWVIRRHCDLRRIKNRRNEETRHLILFQKNLTPEEKMDAGEYRKFLLQGYTKISEQHRQQINLMVQSFITGIRYVREKENKTASNVGQHL